MGVSSKIEWTDATWNPVIGCSRVSEGCRHCYAETIAGRFGSGKPTVYSGLTQIVNGKSVWTGQIKETKQLLQPLSWRTPKRVFVNSMSDLFHENVTDEMRDRIFAVMAMAARHSFQILTKRPANMLRYLTRFKTAVEWRDHLSQIDDDGIALFDEDADCHIANAIEGCLAPGYNVGWPMRNVRLGVSVENQAAADERLDYLCELGSRGWQTMVSFEPLLSAVDSGTWWLSLGGRTWAIVGGESGPGARPMHPEWVRGLRDQCVVAGVPFFFKQWGEWADATNDLDLARRGTCDQIFTASGETLGAGYRKGSKSSGMVDPGWKERGAAWMALVGKKAAGHELDGVAWQQFPEATCVHVK